MKDTVLRYHLTWIENGFSFYDLMEIRENKTDEDPFSNVGLEVLDKQINSSID